MSKTVIASLALFLLTGVEAGAASCYAPVEIEADQAIRLKTDLKTIGALCKDPVYTEFAERNRETLDAYEEILSEHFGRDGGEAVSGGVQGYLARMENAAKQRAERAPNFCADAFDTVMISRGMTPDQLRAYASAQAAVVRRDYAICPVSPGDPPATVTVSLPQTKPPPAAPLTSASATETEVALAARDPDHVLVASLAASDLAAMLDPVDRQRVGATTQQTLETSISGQVVAWRNPYSRNAGTVVAARAYRNAAGQWCRSFGQSITILRETRQGSGTACRRPDGWWDIVP